MSSLIVAFHHYFEIVSANTPELLKEAFRLRYEIYCQETGFENPSCTVSVPNLMSDRVVGVAVIAGRLNVRRLMYQSLIWSAVAGDQPRRLRPSLDAEDLEGLADALVDGMRGNAELDGDFLGRQMLVDQLQAFELPRRQPGNTSGNFRIGSRSPITIRQAE